MFLAIYQFWWYVIDQWKPTENYLSKTESEKAYYIGIFAANTHHIGMFLWGFANLYYPAYCENPYPMQWFYDDVCYMQVDRNMVRTKMAGAGYLFYDLYVMVYYVKSDSALQFQSIAHHLVGAAGIFCGSFVGYGVPGIGNINLMTELSTALLNYREMYDKDQLGLPCFLIWGLLEVEDRI